VRRGRAFIALGFSIGSESMANLRASAGPVVATSWVLALIPVMFTYSGWNAAGYIAEELRELGRNVPRVCVRSVSTEPEETKAWQPSECYLLGPQWTGNPSTGDCWAP